MAERESASENAKDSQQGSQLITDRSDAVTERLDGIIGHFHAITKMLALLGNDAAKATRDQGSKIRQDAGEHQSSG